MVKYAYLCFDLLNTMNWSSQMQDKHTLEAANSLSNLDQNRPAKLSLRDEYTLEVERIKSEIGDLEQIRLQLGLSQRRICKLLMVDPSAWTRWNKTSAPPLVYRALNWLLKVYRNEPQFITPIETSNKIDLLHLNTNQKIKKLEDQIYSLETGMTFSQNSSADKAWEALFYTQELRFKEEVQKLQELLTESIQSTKKSKAKTQKKKGTKKIKKKSAKIKSPSKKKKKPAPKKAPSKKKKPVKKKAPTTKRNRRKKIKA